MDEVVSIEYDMGVLAKALDPDDGMQVVYEFANGREFMKHEASEYDWASDD